MTHPQLLARIATLDAELEKARAERDECDELAARHIELASEINDKPCAVAAERDALRLAIGDHLASCQCNRNGEAGLCRHCAALTAALESTPAPDVKERAAAIVAKAMRREGPKQPPEAVLALYDSITAKAVALPPGHVAAAERLGIGLNQMRTLVREGRLRIVEVGKRQLVTTQSLMQLARTK